MLGLKIHSPANLEEVTPLQATQKILDGFSELAAWAMYEVRNGALVARHPGVTLGNRVFTSVRGVLHDLKARVDADKLCSDCRQARHAAHDVQLMKHDAPPAHPDQTTVHLGPHKVDHHPFPGGIHPHPAPVINPGGNRHPRSAPRHH